MTWPLLVVGILLALFGLWGGPAPRRREAREGRVRTPIAKGDAWEILTQPVITDEELIKIPERRPWYIPGRAGRFQRGLMLGLGIGLLIAAGVHAWAPRDASSRAPEPATGSQTPASGTPTTTSPAVPPVTSPPKPSTVSFKVTYGDMVPTIATNLKAKGLIANEESFISRATERGVDTLFKEGTFTVPTDATLDQVIDALTK